MRYTDYVCENCGYETDFTLDFMNHKCAVSDPISPPHYQGHPSGVECIRVTEHMNFCRGNAMKYLWRAGQKGDEVEDLKKALWYIKREIARLQRAP